MLDFSFSDCQYNNPKEHFEANLTLRTDGGRLFLRHILKEEAMVEARRSSAANWPAVVEQFKVGIPRRLASFTHTHTLKNDGGAVDYRMLTDLKVRIRLKHLH